MVNGILFSQGGVFPCDPLESGDLQCRLGNPMQPYSQVSQKSMEYNMKYLLHSQRAILET